MESDCCNVLIDEGEYICALCGQGCEPVETEEEIQDRLRGQESDWQHIKNIGLTDH